MVALTVGLMDSWLRSFSDSLPQEDMHEARDSVNQQRAGLEFHFKDAYVEWKHGDGSLVLWTEPAEMVPGETAQ
jgi:hypothetical protein